LLELAQPPGVGDPCLQRACSTCWRREALRPRHDRLHRRGGGYRGHPPRAVFQRHLRRHLSRRRAASPPGVRHDRPPADPLCGADPYPDAGGSGEPPDPPPGGSAGAERGKGPAGGGGGRGPGALPAGGRPGGGHLPGAGAVRPGAFLGCLSTASPLWRRAASRTPFAGRVLRR
jgi:hypothetical protein